MRILASDYFYEIKNIYHEFWLIIEADRDDIWEMGTKQKKGSDQLNDHSPSELYSKNQLHEFYNEIWVNFFLKCFTDEIILS